jgi:hypothetical protein
MRGLCLILTIALLATSISASAANAPKRAKSANPNCPYGYGACVKFLMEKHQVLGRDASRRCTYLCSK